MRQIHLLSRDCGSCLGSMAYNELAGMMSKALEQLQRFKSKVSVPACAAKASSPAAVSDAACERLCCAPGCASSWSLACAGLDTGSMLTPCHR